MPEVTGTVAVESDGNTYVVEYETRRGGSGSVEVRGISVETFALDFTGDMTIDVDDRALLDIDRDRHNEPRYVEIYG